MRQERRALLYCIFPFEGFYYSPAFTEKYEKYLSFHISQKELDEIKFHKGIMLSGLKSKNHYSSRYIHELLNRILYLPKTSKLTYRSAVKRTTLVDTES